MDYASFFAVTADVGLDACVEKDVTFPQFMETQAWKMEGSG